MLPAVTSAAPASISREGDTLLDRYRVLDAAALSLAAAANHASLPVLRRPLVAIIATGDELLPPGSDPGPGQIIASNTYGVAAIARAAGAEVVDLGIVRDRHDEMPARVGQALDAQSRHHRDAGRRFGRRP